MRERTPEIHQLTGEERAEMEALQKEIHDQFEKAQAVAKTRGYQRNPRLGVDNGR